MKDFSWFGGWVIKLVITAFSDFARLQEILANSLPPKVTYLSFLSVSSMNFSPLRAYAGGTQRRGEAFKPSNGCDFGRVQEGRILPLEIA
jgi:hypothetical protein